MFVIVMTVFVLGFLVGFMAYHATRVGIHEWRNLNENKKIALNEQQLNKAKGYN